MSACWVDPEYDAVFNSGYKWNIIVNNHKLTFENIIVKCCYSPNSNIIVYFPTRIHIADFFVTLRRKLNAFNCGKWITRDVTAPYHEICLANEVRIRGFASDGVSLCGQNADFIYVHQTENIREAIIKRDIIPILQSTPDTEIAFFFEKKEGEAWDVLSEVWGVLGENKHYKVHDFSVEKDDGMITNPFTGRKSWL